MKKFFALMLALALVFSLTLSSLAAVADYGDSDDTPPPAVAGEGSTSTTVVGGSAAAPAAYVPTSFIENLNPIVGPEVVGTATSTIIANAGSGVSDAVLDAGGTQASADAAKAATIMGMNREATTGAVSVAPSVVFVAPGATMPASAITSISQSAAPVVFVYPFYSIAIAPVSVTQAKDVSLNLGLMATANSIQIRPAMSGIFGMTMDIGLAVPSVTKLTNPRLFYIPNVGAPQDLGPVTMTGSTLSFSINRASAYVIADGVAGAVAAPVTVATPVTTNINPATGAIA